MSFDSSYPTQLGLEALQGQSRACPQPVTLHIVRLQTSFWIDLEQAFFVPRFVYEY